MKFSIFHPMVHMDDATLDVAQLYSSALDITVQAESLGYDAVFFNEGHVREANFRLPNTSLMIAAAARITRTIKLGAGLIILTYHDPKLIAEDAVALDALTRGRYIIGVGTGYRAAEFTQFGIDPKLARPIFDLKAQVLGALLQGRAVNIDTPVYKATYAQSSLIPAPDLRHRYYRGNTSAHGSRATGKAGLGLMLSPNDVLAEDSMLQYQECLAAYHEGWKESDFAALPPPPIYTLMLTHVADTDAAAAQTMTPYVENFKRIIGSSQAHPSGKPYYEYYRHNPLSLMGSAQTVTKRLRTLQRMGAEHILTLHNVGGLPVQQVRDSIQRFANEVIPAFADTSVLEGVA